jgi:hypothetical protein
MDFSAIMPTPASVLSDIALYVGSAPFLGAWAEIRAHLHERSPDGRVIRVRDEIMSDFWAQLWNNFREHAELLKSDGRAIAELQEVVSRFKNHEALGVLANFCEDAYREPLDERRRMLSHAAAGLADASLSVAEYARLWRIIGELEPSDIETLYALWLIPNRMFPNTTRGAAEIRLQELERRGAADALESCRAVAVRVMAGAGFAGKPYLDITLTGRLILRGLRTFIANRPRPPNIPGHVVSGMRMEAEARAFLASTPTVAALPSKYRNHQFDLWPMQFDGVGPDSSPTAKSRIVIRSVTAEDASALQNELTANATPMGADVERLSLDSNQPTHDQPERYEIHIGGPFDVLCWLAYDLNAGWS